MKTKRGGGSLRVRLSMTTCKKVDHQTLSIPICNLHWLYVAVWKAVHDDLEWISSPSFCQLVGRSFFFFFLFK